MPSVSENIFYWISQETKNIYTMKLDQLLQYFITNILIKTMQKWAKEPCSRPFCVNKNLTLATF